MITETDPPVGQPTTGLDHPRQRTITIPAPVSFISLNQRQHWAVKARLTKAWRNAAHVYARQARLPRGLSRVHVSVEVVKATSRRYDVHNLMPTAKAVVDGLIDYGMCADDSNEYVTGPDMRAAGKGEPALVLTITEITQP